MDAYLETAVSAAQAAGELIRKNYDQPLKVNAEEAHDIKLELDVQTQELITQALLKRFPDHGILGEEGESVQQERDYEWVIDPIDGTVNYFYAIPHFCVSIALRKKETILVGVIYDPIKDELWQVMRGQPARLNGKDIKVSGREDLAHSIVSVGFAKTAAGIEAGLAVFTKMLGRARKCRMMGSAALDLAYVACGRFDAYIERSVNWWDIAAGVLLVEAAGGEVSVQPSPLVPGKLSVIATNGRIQLPVTHDI